LIWVKVFRRRMADDSAMTTAIPVTPAVQPGRVVSPPVATVFLPREHGSWFLVLEPLALGLLIAPSWAGGALAAATLAGFFARRPFKPAFSPVHSVRRQVARETVVMWSALAVAGLFEAVVLGGAWALWPLVPAAMLGGWFLSLELQGENRAAEAEVAGSAACAFVPAACATLAGASITTALVLAALALARSVPTVLVVRASLRGRREGGTAWGLPWLASLLAGGALAALAWFHLVPTVALALGGLLLLRAAWLLSPLRPAWPARRIGQAEGVLGVLYILLLVTNWGSSA
jgi:hypothetical protein